MKKIFSAIMSSPLKGRLCGLLFALLTTTALWAYAFQSGDLYYNITNYTTVEVTSKSYSYPYNEGVTFTVVTIPETVTYNGTTYSVTSIGESAFRHCFDLTSITIPNNVTSIGSQAFLGCESLTSVTIPNSVTSIGDGAFWGCSALTSVTIPNSVTSIGDWAFGSCKSLTSMVVESGNSTYDSRENCNAIIETATNTLIAGCQNTTIPNSVTSIGTRAFERCSALTSITIPNSVTSIGNNAFAHCYALTSITIPNSVTSIGDFAFDVCISITSVTIPNNVTSIGDGAFWGCSALTSVTIPNSVTSIGDRAFASCWSLTSMVVESGNSTYDSRENCNAIIETATNTLIAGCQNTIIPNSVTSIGYSAFYGCSSLTSVTIPNSVTSIGYGAFTNCTALTSVTIPNSVTSIGSLAFEGCSSLTSITIPNSVTSIGEGAFQYCSALKTVICEAIEVPELGGSVFYYMPLSEATLYVPAQSLDDYKAAEQWKEFGTILPIEELPTGIKNTNNSSPANPTPKLLRNGQVYILQDGKTYTITGQEL